MKKVMEEDVPPPGAGFTTVTLEVPATATSAAVMAAVSLVALTKEVVLLLPFHCTAEVEMKLFPFTVKVNGVPQLVAAEGESELTDGTGLGGGGGGWL